MPWNIDIIPQLPIQLEIKKKRLIFKIVTVLGTLIVLIFARPSKYFSASVLLALQPFSKCFKGLMYSSNFGSRMQRAYNDCGGKVKVRYIFSLH